MIDANCDGFTVDLVNGRPLNVRALDDAIKPGDLVSFSIEELALIVPVRILIGFLIAATFRLSLGL